MQHFTQSLALMSICLLSIAERANAADRAPNVVVIMSDDQDYRLGSLDAQPFVMRNLAAEGVMLTNHFATVAQCCPSRTSFLRGQAAHNTNMTHVGAPGGGYDKFVASGQDANYLPHWLGAAGYKTSYIGKLMNGYNTAAYSPKPKGWDHTDMLLNPYTYEFNNVVMSQNGERPIHYTNYHQTDVIRAKALSQLQELVKGEQPFYIQIAPASPHATGEGPTEPLARHMWAFNNAKAPRLPNFNPEHEVQSQKPFWIGKLPKLNQSQIDFTDWQYRLRLQALLGVDELVEDVVTFLEKSGQLDNTYVIYTTDNGFHTGNHRQIGGKGFPYIEDTNIPMIIRGPGIPRGIKSTIPSTHIDIAPTLLEIAGLDKAKQPPFLDGRSLLSEWKTAGCQGDQCPQTQVAREILNVEFWGTIANAGKPDFGTNSPIYDFKALRIVDEKSAWLFTRWCDANATELYDTLADPYEIKNLAINPTSENARVIQRLNGILLVTKSCAQDSCRSPWGALNFQAQANFTTLSEAMDPKHDAFFASLPSVGFQYCEFFQLATNEGPYFPPESVSLGSEYRGSTDNYVLRNARGAKKTPRNHAPGGSAAQRHVTEAVMLNASRPLTDEEIGTVVECTAPDYCDALTVTD